MTDALSDPSRFNDDVASTAVVGALRADVRTLRADVKEVKADVKHIRSTTDKWGGGILVVSAIASGVVGIVVSIATAIFF